VALAERVAVGVPALGVRERQPPEEPRQVAVFTRPDDHAPVVGHDAPRHQPHPAPLLRRDHDPLEREVVGLVLEDRHPRIRPVNHVVHIPPDINAKRPSHRLNLPQHRPRINKKVPDTFSSSFVITPSPVCLTMLFVVPFAGPSIAL